ncbi:murein biosynthesis integral membrane protein MurJ [Cellulomonas hominis]
MTSDAEPTGALRAAETTGAIPTVTVSLGRSSAIMAAGTAVSRVLGIVRGAMLVAAIGLTGNAANAFATANKLPNVLYLLIAGGVLNAVLVPQVVRAYRRANGQQYVDRLLTLGILVLLGLTAVVTLAAPLLVSLYSDFADPQVTSLAVLFAYWCIPQLFFYGLYSLLGQVLNARGSFGPYMWAPVVNNVVAIAGLAVFIGVQGRYAQHSAHGQAINDPATWTGGQITLLAGTATVGVVIQALVLIVPLYRSGFRYRPRWGFRGVGLRSAGRVATWTLAALVIGQVGVLIVSRVATSASGSGQASNAVYDNAFTIFMLPHSLVTVSLATALFTRLSATAAAGDRAGVRDDLSLGLRTVGLFTILATAVIAVLAYPIGRALYPTASSAEASSLAVVIVTMILGLTAFGAWSLCQRVYYAYEDARSMFPIQVLMAVVVVGGTLIGREVLDARHWVAGAGVAMTLSYVLGAVLALVSLRRRLGGLDGRRVGVVHGKAVAAAVVAAAVGVLLRRALDPVSGMADALVTSLVSGTAMTAVYLVLLVALRVREVGSLVGVLRSRVRRGRARPSSMQARSVPHRPAGGREDLAVADVSQRDGDGEHGPGTVLAGRYRVLAPVPSDLAGVTSWDATDQILDRAVRVSLLTGDGVTRGLDAARRAALVSDPRLARVLDVGTHDGSGYVVTEQISGRSLADVLAEGPLPADQARTVVGEAAAALEVARRRGVHHLVLRPGVVHVTDRRSVLLSGLALDGALLGRDGGDARTTSRDDTVGLVRVLYAALTGRWPAAPEDEAGPDAPEPRGLPLAPTVDGVAVPPADLVPGVPADLDTLCAVTLGPHDDGPHSPAELVRELEPWGEITSAARFAAPAGTPPVLPAASVPPLAAAGVAAVAAASLPPAIPPVARQSVRSVLDDQPSAGSRMPGTPPPADLRDGRLGSAHSAAPAVPPAPAGGAPGPMRPTWDLPFAGTPAARAVSERRFDPTKSALVLVAVVVVIGVFVAINSLFRPVADNDQAQAPAPAPTTATSAPADLGAAPPPAEVAPVTTPPVIASVTTIDPSDGDGEHEELVGRLTDGDPSTSWYTHTYNRPDFSALKSGVGLAVTLTESTTVTAVTLDVNGSGGAVEVRATDAANPITGTVLASGTLAGQTVLTLTPPTQTQTLVVWFTSLSQTADGANKIDISSLSVS